MKTLKAIKLSGFFYLTLLGLLIMSGNLFAEEWYESSEASSINVQNVHKVIAVAGHNIQETQNIVTNKILTAEFQDKVRDQLLKEIHANPENSLPTQANRNGGGEQVVTGGNQSIQSVTLADNMPESNNGHSKGAR